MSGDSVGDYTLKQRLGDGAFGSVFVAVHNRTKEEYAVKIVNVDLAEATQSKNLVKQEAAIMQNLQHPHVVRLFQVIQTPHNVYLVMELAKGGELFDRVIESKSFPEHVARKYFQQLVSALYYCHQQGIAHRDLKAENLLVDEKGNLKVCDFGVSCKMFDKERQQAASPELSGYLVPEGTITYMSPEMLNSDIAKYDPHSSDMWSAGIILYFMLTGRLPFDGREEVEIEHLIKRGVYDSDAIASIGAKDVVNRLLAHDPDERISMEELIHHPWFLVGLDQTLFPFEQLEGSRPRGFLDFSQVGSPANDATQEELLVIEKAFQIIDIDGNDEITAEQIRDVLINLNDGNEVQWADACALFQAFTQEGKATFEAFCDAWINKNLAKVGRKEFQLQCIVQLVRPKIDKSLVPALRRSFNSINYSKSGRISPEEWKQLFVRSQLTLSRQDLNELISCSSHKNDFVTFDDFIVAVAIHDLLERQHLGAKLAFAASLTTFVLERNAVAILTTGLTVAGQKDEIIGKMVCFCGNRIALVDSEIADAATLHFLRPEEQQTPRAQRLPMRSPSLRSKNVICELDASFNPISLPGYTSVKLTRILGATSDFHDAVRMIVGSLENDHQKVVHDTSPVGESELL